jgi:two-component system, OmpR family, sensor histidine kinase KdpD
VSRRRPEVREVAVRVGAIVAALIVASGVVGLLQSVVRVPNASSAYLLAVIVLAVGFGTFEAVATALGSFLAYDFLFVEPVHTFAIVDSGEWLNLLLLLIVSLVVGQLAGRQRHRAETAELREREARGLFHVSQALASADQTAAALQDIVAILRDETRMGRVWIGLAGATPLERVVADSGAGRAVPTSSRHAVLRRGARPDRSAWVAVHTTTGVRRSVGDVDFAAHRVPIERENGSLGSLWALRLRSLGTPSDEETRLLSAAADQIAQALERDRLRTEATGLEVARRSEALKTALLDSVSHDLRTPLATIRAAAGSLVNNERRASHRAARPAPDHPNAAAVIDRQAAYLDRLVTNLLDMSRIEAGALRPDRRPILLDDTVADTIERLGVAQSVTTDVPISLPPVLVDEVYLDAIITNVLENAVAYAPSGAPIVVRGTSIAPDRIRLTVEDAGPGVPAATLDRLFEKFYRAPAQGAAAPHGSGIGLAVVRGLVEASGGRARARLSELGGLAIDIDLPVAASSPRADELSRPA